MQEGPEDRRERCFVPRHGGAEGLSFRGMGWAANGRHGATSLRVWASCRDMGSLGASVWANNTGVDKLGIFFRLEAWQY